MKGRNKKFIVLLGITILLFFVISGSNVKGWKNGPGESGILRICSTNAASYGWSDPVECYKLWFQMEDTQWFSTHDYLALFALDYLCESDPMGKYNWLRDVNQRYLYIYLLATEYPDIIAGDAPHLILDYGKYETGIDKQYGDPTTHGLIEGPVRAKKDAARAIKALNGKLGPGKLRETTAFYLGTMAHYICDLSHPSHSVGSWPGDFHGWSERQVSRFTTLSEYYLNGNGMFFDIDLESKIGYNPSFLVFVDAFRVIYQSSTSGTLGAEKIAWFCANILGTQITSNYETDFAGKGGDGSLGVGFFYDFYGTNRDFTFSYDNRNDPMFKDFYDRLEILLNWAVFFTACALKACLDEEDEDVEENTDRPLLPDKFDPDRYFLPPEAYEYLARFGWLIGAFVASGIIARKIFGGKYR